MDLIVLHVNKTLNPRVENWIDEMIRKVWKFTLENSSPKYITLVVQVDACFEKVLNAKSRIPLSVALPFALFAAYSG